MKMIKAYLAAFAIVVLIIVFLAPNSGGKMVAGIVGTVPEMIGNIGDGISSVIDGFSDGLK